MKSRLMIEIIVRLPLMCIITKFSTLYANMINLPARVKFTAALYMK